MFLHIGHIKRSNEGGINKFSNEAKIREAAKRLNPIDDIFFRVMAEDRLVCQEILQTILEDPGLTVLHVTPQRDLKNLQGRSVRLDAECILGNGKHADVEVQRSDNDDHQRRVRYNAACLTTNITDPGTRFRDVPDVIMAYISEFDLFGEEYTTYHVDRILRETGETVENGMTEIYVNAAVNDGSPTADLMKVFTNDESYDRKNFPRVSEQKWFLKNEPEGVSRMSNIIRELFKDELLEARTEASAEGRAEGLEEGRAEGRAEGHLEMLTNLVRKGLLSAADAAKELSISETKFRTFL